MRDRMRKALVITIIALSVIVVVHTPAHAQEIDGYILTLSGVSPDTGEHSILGYNASDTYASCAYNMGVILSQYWSDELIGDLQVPYTEFGNHIYVAFWDKDHAWLLHMTCMPVNTKV